MRFGRLKYGGLLWVAACCLTSMAVAQDTTKKGDVSDALPDMVELSPFGGVSLFGQINRGLGEKLINGGTGGGRVAFNLDRHWGIELNYNFSGNNVRLVTPAQPGLPSFGFAEQNHQLSLDPVYNLRPRGSRLQPYVTAGVGIMKFIPTKQGLDFATNPANTAIYQSGALGRSDEVAFNYGGGVKFHVSRYFGVRFDVRGLTLPSNPTFKLPAGSSTGGVYIVPKNLLNGLDATVGMVFYLGQHIVPLPPLPPTPPINAGDITGEGGQICVGQPVKLHSTASDPATPSRPLKFMWKLNGAPQSAEGPDFTFTPNNAGDFKVEVSIVDTTDPKRLVSATPKTVTVQDYMPPQITSVTATPALLVCAANDGAHSAALAGEATGSACGGALSYKWTVSEGSVSGDTSQNATFDASTLNFESGGQAQAKSVTATLTATDTTGKSASQTTTITVNCAPVFKRLPDIVFAKNSPRVNNCGKRILIDQAAPQAGGGYDIILVSHRSADEKESLSTATKKGRKAAAARKLDEQRALNAAAVLMNGGSTKAKATCATVDPTQIKIDSEGTDQTSTPDPGLCGTSNLPPTQKERKGATVSEADKERRVEVYLVPKGSKGMPPAAKNAQPVPESVVKAIGCPK